MDKLKSTESNTVTGDAFYNREVERKIIRQKVETGTHQLLTGQRRMGKSSLAREIGRALEETGEWNYIFVDLQACGSGVELVTRLGEEINKHEAFSSKIRTFVKKLAKKADDIDSISAAGISISLKDNLNASNWKSEGRKILQLLESSDKPTYLVLDEFPDLITKLNNNVGVTAVAELLDWLRPEIQSTVSNAKLSLLISGSIGLEPILHRLKLSNKINNLASYRLKPWKREIAKNCFIALSNYESISVDDDAIEYFLDQLGIYIPFHIQRAWAKLYEYLLEESKTSATKSDLEYVFKEIIVKSESNSMISHYEERLAETLGQQYYPVAIRLLDEMCSGKAFTTKDANNFKHNLKEDIDIHYILGVLHHDGYLDIVEDDWIFNPSLLRQWWQKRMALR